MVRTTCKVLLTAVLAVAAAGTVRAFTRAATGSGAAPVYLHWTTTPIYKINDQTSDALSNVASGSDPAEAVRRGFATWLGVPSATVQVTDGGSTTITHSGQDGTNLISFVDTGFAFNGALGVTRLFFSVSTGQISEADIVFNPAVSFATRNPLSGVADVQEVATHEIGHFLGLTHVGILSATMYPYARPQSQIERFLDVDDVAGISEIYPAGSFATEFGTIAGTITRNSAPEFGAHVVAVDPDGRPAVSALTLKDGTFTIPGLPPSTYNLYVEPLDGPASQGNFSGWWTTAAFDSTFRSKFKGGGTPDDLVVAAGQTLTGNDVALDTASSTINAVYVGKQPASGGGFSVATTLTTVLQGEVGVWNIVLAGTGLTSPTTFEILGPGVTRTSGFSYGSFMGGPPYVLATFSFDAAASAVPRVIRVDNSGETILFTGAIEILPSPSVLHAVRDPLHPDSVYLWWYGGSPPYNLRRSGFRDFSSPVDLLNETDSQYRDPVLLDGNSYYYRIAE